MGARRQVWRVIANFVMSQVIYPHAVAQTRSLHVVKAQDWLIRVNDDDPFRQSNDDLLELRLSVRPLS